MSRVAWRGFVRVMRPRIVSFTLGMAAVKVGFVAEVDETVMLGCVFLEGAEDSTVPARLAWMDEAKMWLPVLGVCDVLGASESPGSANLGTAMLCERLCGEDENIQDVMVWCFESCNSSHAPAFVRMRSPTLSFTHEQHQIVGDQK